MHAIPIILLTVISGFLLGATQPAAQEIPEWSL